MLKLLIKKPFNRELKENEKLQISYEKKFGVERIFGENVEDIYFDEKSLEYQRIGTLFLDYLSDDISELYSEFMNDICRKMSLEQLKAKYISSYTFYFKYFFNNSNNYEKDIEDIKLLEENKVKELIERVVKEMKKIEDTKTIDELLKEFKSVYYNLIRGKSISKGSEIAKNTNKPIRKEEKISDITQYFLKKIYLKQIYKFIIEYCYFRKKTIDTKKESNKIRTRFIDFKTRYEEKYYNIKWDMLDKINLAFFLPKSIATINEKGEIAYTYLLDEEESITKGITYTITFFRISLLELLETDRKIAKCKNCGRYFILKKSNTNYCNNPSPQNNNQTCSEYMKAKNYKERNDNNEIVRERKRAIDRTRLSFKPINMKSEKAQKRFKEDMYKWKQEEKEKRKMYEKGKITKEEYLNWLKNTHKARKK